MSVDRPAAIDTHVAVWLYEGGIERFSAPAQETLESAQLILPGMAFLELEFLHEIGRIDKGAHAIFRDLHRRVGLAFSQATHAAVVEQSLTETWTRDPFDRVIVAEARLLELPLVTKDRNIRKRYERVVW
ncbi:MAG: PIN domain-containing protein [Vicinamibacteria bacterium]